MPLLDGRPVPLCTSPAAGYGAHAHGWQIRFTGEVFDDYDKYLDRLMLYRRPVWTCKESGRTCLTYEQALLEERAERHRSTGIGFSDALICEMLSFMNQSTLPVLQAMDVLYYRFRYDFFPGEHLDVKYPDTEGAMYECCVVSVGPLPQAPALGMFPGSLARDLGDDVPIVEISGRRMASPASLAQSDSAIERLGAHACRVIAHDERKHRMYTVRLYDVDGGLIDNSDIAVPATELSRSRNVFTKVALRQFLNDHLRHDARSGGPWVVRPEWRERFRIPYNHCGGAQALRLPRANSKRASGAFYMPGDETLLDTLPAGVAGVRLGSSPLSSSGRQRKCNAIVLVDPHADERDPGLKIMRKFPANDLEYVNYKHARLSQSALWAYRRKAPSPAGMPADSPLSKGRKSYAITKYFAVSAGKRSGPGEPEPESGVDNAEDESGTEDPDLACRWPVPLCKWQVPLALVSRALAVYMFVSCYSAPLKLDPYPLDYLESALVHSLPPPATGEAGEDSLQSPPVATPVYRESVIALLNSIIDDRQRSGLPPHVASRIDAMVDAQNAALSDHEEVDIVADAAPMDISDNEAAPPKLPPIGPQAALTRTGNRQASSAATRVGRSRLQRSTRLTNSSSIASSESDSGSESNGSAASAATAASTRRGRGRRRAAPSRKGMRNGRAGPSSVASSRATTPASVDSDQEDSVPSHKAANGGRGAPKQTVAAVAMAKLASLQGHALLRHLSRTWAAATIGPSRDMWAAQLAGWIIEARQDYPELAPIASALWDNSAFTLEGLEAALWGAADVEMRLVLLELLAVECANNDSIREYLEKCADAMQELRRERAELRREHKRITEALGDLDREEAQEDGAGASEISREQGRKEKEQEIQRQKDRRKLGESERQQRRRLDHVEREMRRNSIGRLTPLGMDRFFNGYYLIDGIGSCPATGATGRIFVRPASRGEQLDATWGLPMHMASIWAMEMPAAWVGELVPRAKDSKLMDLAWPGERPAEEAEMRALGARGELWGYYATQAQVDALKRWLDPKGKRESALLAELELHQTAIASSIRRRCQTLERSLEARTRARKQLCDKISARLDASVDPAGGEDAVLAGLNEELAQLDRALVPPALLPPALLAAEENADGGAANGAEPAAESATGAEAAFSSRASSAEPPPSVDLNTNPTPANPSAKRLAVLRQPRGRRPKNRGPNARTYMDDFLAYENAGI
ncbi:hypothetical protein IWQ57_001585 [Coemansia nantahalensis]|uniref:Uncharacterized protein n=1 Tax=Coemansia nantahalensis TaxID=2789366 RepID=A0ACC1K3F1_9FUNG|nr:hypothetical protein IWQ57_001585 [Coemansia nantahalensis]